MLFVTIVLDGVGAGEQPDAAAYSDEGSHTLAHICESVEVSLPNLTRLGLGCITPLRGVPPVTRPAASFGRMREVSAGKDSTTGHWELAGLLLDRPFPTYPDGFPPEVIDRFLQKTGVAGILGNIPASGTTIITELGEEHQETGYPIVYTSADSVLQIAAHVETIPLEELYRICSVVREEVCVGPHAVGRVIARPFAGEPGAFARISESRKDFSIRPPAGTIQERIQRVGVTTISIGKIADLFGGVGFHEAYKTRSNEEGIAVTLAQIRRYERSDRPAFIWVNLVDFDQEYGHRNDPVGFARALEEFDRAIPALMGAMPPSGRLVITADHGNDPITPSTDHSREYVPVLFVNGNEGRDLGVRSSFRDHAATIAASFGLDPTPFGSSFEEAPPPGG